MSVVTFRRSLMSVLLGLTLSSHAMAATEILSGTLWKAS